MRLIGNSLAASLRVLSLFKKRCIANCSRSSVLISRMRRFGARVWSTIPMPWCTCIFAKSFSGGVRFACAKASVFPGRSCPFRSRPFSQGRCLFSNGFTQMPRPLSETTGSSPALIQTGFVGVGLRGQGERELFAGPGSKINFFAAFAAKRPESIACAVRAGVATAWARHIARFSLRKGILRHAHAQIASSMGVSSALGNERLFSPWRMSRIDIINLLPLSSGDKPSDSSSPRRTNR